MPSVPASADSQFARTRHTLRRVSPRVRPAPAGQVPTTLEAPGRREAWRRDPQDARARNVKVTWTVLPMGFKNDE